jgi:hypothetical protein
MWTLACCGHRDADTGAPLTADTTFRIYSMSKPTGAWRLMLVYEEARRRFSIGARRDGARRYSSRARVLTRS